MSELKPCPFCGCKAQTFFNDLPSQRVYGVSCMCCTAKVYGWATKETAENRWNRRAYNER